MQHTRFKENKALALAASFLRLRGGEMKHLKLVKLMYLADRAAFERWGHSITGDNYVSMKYGPVPSTVLDLFHEQSPRQKTLWSEHISESEPHTVRLLKDPGAEALSEAEDELASDIFREFGHRNRWELVDLTHKFPEFKEPENPNGRSPIPCEEILKAVGRTDSEARAISQQLEETANARRLLAL